MYSSDKTDPDGVSSLLPSPINTRLSVTSDTQTVGPLLSSATTLTGFDKSRYSLDVEQPVAAIVKKATEPNALIKFIIASNKDEI